MEWIRHSGERNLPVQEGEEILVVVRNDDGELETWFVEVEFEGSAVHTLETDCDGAWWDNWPATEILYWMPKPKPPKE